MKLSVMGWVALTTSLLVAITIAAAMDAAFNWIFFATVGGQVLVGIMVWRVLTDDYSTDKTFEDFYEDYPVGRE